jgi:hypothetical protein
MTRRNIQLHFSGEACSSGSSVSDPRVAQYWDKNHPFAGQLADATQPKPNCCTRWDSQLPRAVYLNGPVVRSVDFSKVVADLLSK